MTVVFVDGDHLFWTLVTRDEMHFYFNFLTEAHIEKESEIMNDVHVKEWSAEELFIYSLEIWFLATLFLFNHQWK